MKEIFSWRRRKLLLGDMKVSFNGILGLVLLGVIELNVSGLPELLDDVQLRGAHVLLQLQLVGSKPNKNKFIEKNNISFFNNIIEMKASLLIILGSNIFYDICRLFRVHCSGSVPFKSCLSCLKIEKVSLKN